MDCAYQIVQNLNHQWANWIHTYLHCKEPDLSNAAYWYSGARKKMLDYSYEKEWKEISEFIEKAEIKNQKVKPKIKTSRNSVTSPYSLRQKSFEK